MESALFECVDTLTAISGLIFSCILLKYFVKVEYLGNIYMCNGARAFSLLSAALKPRIQSIRAMNNEVNCISRVESFPISDLKRPVSDATSPVKKPRKLKKYKAKPVEPTSSLGVLTFEINELLNENNLNRNQIETDVIPILNDVRNGDVQQVYNRKVESVEILRLTTNGDGLAIIPNPVDSEKKQVAVVPFALVGDVVSIKVDKTHPTHVDASLLRVHKAGALRKEDLISCKYFGRCSGCQYQHIPYEVQLELKKRTLSNAFRFFAPNLVREGRLPTIIDTAPSPLQLFYRTKLTPHFDVSRKLKTLEYKPPLGFGQKGRPKWRNTDIAESGSILDIEECLIGTEIVNKGMKNERAKFDKTFKNYKKGATILLREHTKFLNDNERIEDQLDEGSREAESNAISYVTVGNPARAVKTCVTNGRQIVSEHISGYTLQFSAGEFFQNNNSILPMFIEYIRENLKGSNFMDQGPYYLVDAYCGSGLFSITLSEGIDRVIGVEVSADSVAFAKRNAEANGVENCTFIVGKAEMIFASIDSPCDRTSVILDPPRKGCDEVFLKQLAEYNPARIIYISCNVHSQARDVEFFIKNTVNGADYKIESLRGFDFFPQTHHVEGVCVLSRI